MKRLVVCLDGTWNNPEMLQKANGRVRYRPTNVLKTYRAILPQAADGTSQISFYLEGVGAFVGEKEPFGRVEKVVDRALGGIFGGGFEGRVKGAYRFLVANYEPGDQIFIFGFSRGAAQARSLAGFIDWLGGVLHKKDEYYIPELFDRYRDTRARTGAGATSIRAIQDRHRKEHEHLADPQQVEIAFLGVYDTVFSLGSRIRADRSEGGVRTVERKYAFHVASTPQAIVRVARQALAIDESRWDYRPQVWIAAADDKQSVEQRWFPGVHTNVGGGRSPDGLGNAALWWMVREAHKAGLDLDTHYLGFFEAHLGLPASNAWYFRVIDAIRFKLGRGRRELLSCGGGTLRLDGSAVDLLLQEPAYRPANLLAALRVESHLLDDIPAEQRREVLALARSTSTERIHER